MFGVKGSYLTIAVQCFAMESAIAKRMWVAPPTFAGVGRGLVSLVGQLVVVGRTLGGYRVGVGQGSDGHWAGVGWVSGGRWAGVGRTSALADIGDPGASRARPHIMTPRPQPHV